MYHKVIYYFAKIRYLRLIDLTLYCCRLTLGFGGLYKYVIDNNTCACKSDMLLSMQHD